MKIIEQAGFAQRRGLLTFEGSERNAAAWVAMNASRGFPPPGRRAALRRQEVIRHGRSGDRDGINEIHGDNKFADNGEPAAAGRAGCHVGTIGIRNFDKCHEFFETLTSCRRRK